MGGTITSQEAVAPTDNDMRPVLTKISTGSPEFLYYPIFIAAGGHITRQVKEVKGLEKVALMGADGIFSTDFYKAAAINVSFSLTFGLQSTAGFRGQASRNGGNSPLPPWCTTRPSILPLKVAKKAPDDPVYLKQKLRDAHATKNLKD
jgi:ABC-type branched-subunit amino acid transport system substrate-binding protein